MSAPFLSVLGHTRRAAELMRVKVRANHAVLLSMAGQLSRGHWLQVHLVGAALPIDQFTSHLVCYPHQPGQAPRALSYAKLIIRFILAK